MSFFKFWMTTKVAFTTVIGSRFRCCRRDMTTVRDLVRNLGPNAAQRALEADPAVIEELHNKYLKPGVSSLAAVKKKQNHERGVC